MKLYIIDKATHEKRYLPYKANSRAELMQVANFPTGYFQVGNHVYHVNDIHAEPTKGMITAGSVIGGLLGFFGGPITAIIGAVLGAAYGIGENEKLQANVYVFNNRLTPV